jgi:hypothetical protein
MSRDAFRNGIELLRQLQRKLEQVPKRKLIKDLVKQLIKEAELSDDPRRSYFQLLATCALMGRESMYWNFKRKRRINI